MPPALLRSQLDTLEPLGLDEDGVVVDIEAPVAEVVARSLDALGLGRCETPLTAGCLQLPFKP